MIPSPRTNIFGHSRIPALLGGLACRSLAAPAVPAPHSLGMSSRTLSFVINEKNPNGAEDPGTRLYGQPPPVSPSGNVGLSECLVRLP